MGAINVSPGSFYPGSVVTAADELLRAAERMVAEGAAIIDVGAMSTAPYLAGRVSEAEEADRLGWAVGLLSGKLGGVPISADTSRVEPARAALEAGAGIINGVRGLMADAGPASLAARSPARPFLMASQSAPVVPAPPPLPA